MEPKIRIKGYSSEWRPYRISEIGKTYSGISGKKKEDFGVGSSQYVTFLNVLNNAIIDVSILEPVNIQKADHQNNVQKWDLFFNTSSETPEEVGMCATIDEDIPDLYLNSFCFGFRLLESMIDPACFTYMMRGPVGRGIMSVLAQGATRYNLSKRAFCKVDVFLPTEYKEQEAIGRFFNSVTALISEYTLRLESLRQFKSASLQSMFPQKGKAVPRVRFFGFGEEWDPLRLDDICQKGSSLLSEGSLGPNIGDYPVYGASGYIQNIPSFEIDKPYVGIIKDGSGVGRARLYPAKSSLLGTMQYILPKDGYDISFLAYLLEVFDFSKYVNGSSIPHIYFKDYCGEYVYVPKLEEQQQIGAFFSALDKQILLQEAQIEKLLHIKAACLDQMFV